MPSDIAGEREPLDLEVAHHLRACPRPRRRAGSPIGTRTPSKTSSAVTRRACRACRSTSARAGSRACRVSTRNARDLALARARVDDERVAERALVEAAVGDERLGAVEHVRDRRRGARASSSRARRCRPPARSCTCRRSSSPEARLRQHALASARRCRSRSTFCANSTACASTASAKPGSRVRELLVDAAPRRSRRARRRRTRRAASRRAVRARRRAGTARD